MNQAKTLYYCEKVKEANGNQRELFNITKNLFGEKEEPQLPCSNSPSELAEAFSDFFITKIVTIRDKLNNKNSIEPPLSPAKLKCWEPDFDGVLLASFTPASEEEIK